MTERGDGAFVSLREVYDIAVGVRGDVAELKVLVQADKDERAEVKRRIRSLELKVYTVLAGLVTAAGVLAASARGGL